jgi:multiple sugar transport system substrate-binding protein
MKKLLVLILMITLIIGVLAGCGSNSSDSTSKSKNTVINALFMKQAGYSEEEITAITKEFMNKNPNIEIKTTFVPYESLEQKILTGAPTGGYDLVAIDAPWTAKFAKAGIVKEVTEKLSATDRQDIFDGALDAVSFQDKLYGLPWLNDTKFLFYNKELLKQAGFDHPPATWEELEQQAIAMKKQGLVEYPLVWSWKQSEALVCDFTSLSAVFGGGMIKNGKPSLTDEGNKKAMNFMLQTLKEGITNPNSTEFLEEDVRGVFSSGKAAFALNWTYMNSSANDPEQSKVAGKVGITPSPGHGDVVSASVNGGMGLSLTSGTKNPDETWKYLEYLSSKEVQKKYAKSALPIWKSLYKEQEVISTNPDVVTASKVQYDYLTNRPQVPWYGSFSNELQVGIQQVLMGQKSTDDVFNDLQKKAEELANK